MKIVLATGIFYPDVGGPAIHVRKIAEALEAAGIRPVVIAYGDGTEPDQFNFPIYRISRGYGKISRWWRYFFKLLRLAFQADVIYAFDPSAAGLPAFIVAKILNKKFIIRIGGDPIWERIVETGKRFISLDDYYAQGLYLLDRPWLYRWIRFLVRHSNTMVLYNEMFKEFYRHYFGVDPKIITVIPNPVYKRGVSSSELPTDPIMLFAGRFVAYKNLPLVIRAFERVRTVLNRGQLMLIGHGPDRRQLEEQIAHSPAKAHISVKDSLPQDQLFKLINEAAVAIGPALSEFNPNFILEALSFGKPVLLSQGHGLTLTLPTEFEFDPASQTDLERKWLWLLDPDNYRQAVDLANQLPRTQTWDKVTASHIKLIKDLVTKA